MPMKSSISNLIYSIVQRWVLTETREANRDCQLKAMYGGLLCIVFLVPIHSNAQLKKANLQKADRAKWGQILKIPSDCEKRFAFTANGVDYSGLAFDRINSGETLVIGDCYTGAYQPGVILYLLKEAPTQNATLLRLDGVDADTDDDGKPLPYQMFDGLVHFYRKTNTLEIVQEYRGLGDCGRFLRFHYKGDGFKLFEVREQKECGANGGRSSTDFHHWPMKPNP